MPYDMSKREAPPKTTGTNRRTLSEMEKALGVGGAVALGLFVIGQTYGFSTVINGVKEAASFPADGVFQFDMYNHSLQIAAFAFVGMVLAGMIGHMIFSMHRYKV